jgi:hypothetical protein
MVSAERIDGHALALTELVHLATDVPRGGVLVRVTQEEARNQAMAVGLADVDAAEDGAVRRATREHDQVLLDQGHLVVQEWRGGR